VYDIDDRKLLYSKKVPFVTKVIVLEHIIM